LSRSVDIIGYTTVEVVFMLLAGKERTAERQIALGQSIPSGLDSGAGVLDLVSTLDRKPATVPQIYEVGPVSYGVSEIELAFARHSLHAHQRAQEAASRHEPDAGSLRHRELARRALAKEVTALAGSRTDKYRDLPWLNDVGGDASDREADARFRFRAATANAKKK
jgi:hypothetical protein